MPLQELMRLASEKGIVVAPVVRSLEEVIYDPKADEARAKIIEQLNGQAVQRNVYILNWTSLAIALASLTVSVLVAIYK